MALPSKDTTFIWSNGKGENKANIPLRVEEESMCNCIKEAEERIQRERGAALVQWDNFASYKSIVRIVPFRKDGERSKVSQYISVKWIYCPLCGKRIRG